MPPLSSRSPSPTGTANGHFALLDWLRFLAAFLVVCCHARPEHWVAWSNLAAESRNWGSGLFFLLIRTGPEAVVVFFVLSGYLVGGKVLQRSRAGTFKPAGYFQDRASRIFTPLLPALVLTIVCWRLSQGDFPDGFWLQLLGNITQMQGILCDRLSGNAPLWSLSYEVWFYTLAGALAVLTLRQPSTDRVIASTSLALFSLWCLVMLETTYFFCWAMGALAYEFPVRNSGRGGLAAAGVLALIGVCLSQATGAYQVGLVASSDTLHQLGTLLLGGSIAFLMPALTTGGMKFQNSRLARLGPRLAAFSYTLYLTHFPLLLVMRSWHEPYAAFTTGSLLLYAGKVLACVVAAWLIYLPFERNTRHVRDWLRRFSRPPTTIAQTARNP